MGIISFAAAVQNTTLADNFIFGTDILDLEAAATEVQVKFGTTSVTFITVAGSVTLNILATELVSAAATGENILTTAGYLLIGDNTTDPTLDDGNDVQAGHATEGNQYWGRGGNDDFSGGAGGDLVYGNQGDDTIIGNGGPDSLYGGQGDDSIDGGLNAGQDGNMLIYGQLDSDTLLGGSKNDLFYGGQGNDSIVGQAGDDMIYGNKGDDIIQAGSGADTVVGWTGDDTIDGGGGHDIIYGNQGGDQITGGTGDDSLYGGQGDDNINFGDGAVLVYGNLDDDTITGGSGSATIYGGQGTDSITGPTVGFDDPSTTGRSAANVLYGNKGDDILFAGDMAADSIANGNDLWGGPGNDGLVAGAWGADHMWGGSGSDAFYWDARNANELSAIGKASTIDMVYGFETIDYLAFGLEKLFAATPGNYAPMDFFSAFNGTIIAVTTVTPAASEPAGRILYTHLIDVATLNPTGKFTSYKTAGATPTIYAITFEVAQSQNLAALVIKRLMNTTGGATIDKSTKLHVMGMTFANSTALNAAVAGNIDIYLF